MNSFIGFAFMILVISGCGCGACDDGYNPCGYSKSNRTGKLLVSLHLDSIGTHNFPVHLQDKVVTFVNITTQAQMPMNYGWIAMTQISANGIFKRKDSDNCGVFYWEDYANLDRQYMSLSGSFNQVFDMYMERRVVPGVYHNTEYGFDSIGFCKTTERFSIIWKNLYFVINFSDTTASNYQQFHSKITLGNNTYDSLFEFRKYPINAQMIEPHGVYFSSRHGIVGFYLTNHMEEWVKK